MRKEHIRKIIRTYIIITSVVTIKSCNNAFGVRPRWGRMFIVEIGLQTYDSCGVEQKWHEGS